MDDTEDDARYPPNPRRPFPPSHRSKLPGRNPPFAPPIGRAFPAEYDDEDDDEDEDQNGMDHAMEEPDREDDGEEDEDEYPAGYRRVRDTGVNDEDEDDDSSESRGKRRKIDRYALGFEFAPRAAAAAAAAPNPPPFSSRSPADWSEESTFVLLDAWGELYIQNGRKSLRSDEWSEVAEKVRQASKTPRSDAQCRNRLDTLKKKYKKEKAKMVGGAAGPSTSWVYFDKMDALMSSPSPPPPASRQPQPPRLPCGVDAGEYVFESSRSYLNRSNGMDEMRDSPGDTGSEDDGDEEDSDGLPPGRANGGSHSSFRMLADSIQKFGEIYEKIENSKRQQMAELEKMRKDFHKDLETQKRQILERAQAEIARIREEEGDEEEGEDEDDDDDGDDDEIDGST